MIAAAVDAGAEAQPSRLEAAPSGTTTGPATPAAPLWMCAAFGVAMFLKVNSQQTLPPEIVIWALPEPLASPFGVSAFPVRVASSFPFDPPAARATAGTAA